MNKTNSLDGAFKIAMLSGGVRGFASIADTLRFKHGWTYDQIERRACKVLNISPAQWDEYMYQADNEEAKG